MVLCSHHTSDIGNDDDLAPDYAFTCVRDLGLDPEPVLFEEVDPMDVFQGYLGDCWLLSAMASIAEYPFFLRRIIEQTGEGIYKVHLHSYETGEIESIEINDFFPSEGDFLSASLVYVKQSKQSEIWPCLLEKAFAKMAGGYSCLDGGFSSWAFGAMVACDNIQLMEVGDAGWTCYQCAKPTSNNPQDYNATAWWGEPITDPMGTEQLMDMLASYDHKKYMMCCSSKFGTGSDQDVDDKNIHYGHAYTILQVAKNPAGSDVNLIKLRNPWGTSEWSGAWADSDPIWNENPDIASAVGFADLDNGAFWMPIEALGVHYQQIFVCCKSMTGFAAVARAGRIQAEEHCHCVLQ